MIGRAIVFAVFAFVFVGLPAAAQTVAGGDFATLLQAAESGKLSGPDLLKAVDAYVAAHPQDGNGYALQCSLAASRSIDNGSDGREALPLCTKAVALAPESMFANVLMGNTLYDVGQAANSIPYYSKAIKLGMTDGGIFWRRCDAYRLTGNLDAAQADCKRQLELTPDNFETRYAYGHLQYTRHDYAEALAYLSSALELIPRAIDAVYWRGMTYAALAKPELAAADFTTAISEGDAAGDTYFQRGKARLALGQTALGTADLESALKIYRTNGMNASAAKTEEALAGLRAGTSTPTPPSPAPIDAPTMPPPASATRDRNYGPLTWRTGPVFTASKAVPGTFLS